MLRDRIEVTEGQTVVYLVGDVDMPREAELLAFLGDAVAMGNPVVIDASDLDFIDSTGLRILIITQRLCAEAGATLALRKVKPPFERVLELAGMTAVIPQVS